MRSGVEIDVPGYAAAGRSPGHRRAGVDRPGRAAALPRLARRRHLRRVGRLVRRRRLRQVRHQRSDRGVAAAEHPRSLTGRRAGSPTSAGGSSTGCCGCRCPRGARWPGMAFHRVHGTRWSPLPGLAAPRPDRARPAPPLDHRHAAPGCRSRGRAHATSARSTPRTRTGWRLAARSAYDAARLHPDVLPPDDHARHGGGPYDDGSVGDDFYWAAAELWLATGDHAYESRGPARPEHLSDPFDAAGFDFDAVSAPGPARPGAARHRAGRPRPGGRQPARRRRPARSTCSPGSRGASPTRRPTGGPGDRTAGS